MMRYFLRKYFIFIPLLTFSFPAEYSPAQLYNNYIVFTDRIERYNNQYHFMSRRRKSAAYIFTNNYRVVLTKRSFFTVFFKVFFNALKRVLVISMQKLKCLAFSVYIYIYIINKTTTYIIYNAERSCIVVCVRSLVSSHHNIIL